MKNFLNWLGQQRGFRWLGKDKKKQKAMSFRVFATAGTFAVAFVLTGNPIGSVSIATAQALTNTTIFYYHEKYWEEKPKEEVKELTKEQKEHLRKYGDFINE